jgi:hypothetical protein
MGVHVSSEYQRLSALHDREHAVAATIRTIDQGLKAAGTTVDAMKRELEVIVKNFPPFPPGSEERVRRLRSYAALRTMIDRLTFPPEEQTRMAGEKGKKAEPAATDDWTFVVESKGMTKTVRAEDVRRGAAGFPLPEFSPPDAVDDATIHQALGRLEEVSVGLIARRERLREQTAGVPGSQGDKGMTENRVETRSLAVRKSLVGQPVALAPGSTAQLEQLMG